MGILDRFRSRAAEATDTTPMPGASAAVASEKSSFGRTAHDGASRISKQVALWTPNLTSADRDLLPEKNVLDARVRDSLRNDSYVQGGATVHKDNIVGSLFALNAKPALRTLGAGFDEKWEEDFQEEVEERFTLWAESPDNWPDASRGNNFTDMVRLAVGVHVAAGEVLSSVEWLRDFGRPFSTAVQMIDTDRLSTPPDRATDERIRGGVLKNQYGAPQGYFVRRHHPHDLLLRPQNWEWRFVPARKPWGRLQMIHIFEQTRIDQSRGVAGMVSALKEMRITKQFRDVVLQNAVVNATFAAAIESDLPSNEVYASLGGNDNPGAAMGAAGAEYLAQVAEYSGQAKGLAIDGVKIPHLFPGTKLSMMSPGQGGPLGTDFETSLLRYIAASLGVSYEELSRDFSKTNYSSARAAMNETRKRMGAVKRLVADRFAGSIYRLWLEEVVNRGVLDSLPAAAKREGWLYEDQRLDALSRCEWIGASRGQIDELKETQAAVLRLKYNLSTDEIEASRLGQDWRAIKRQRARERAMDTKLGIAQPDQNDNMMNASTGEPSEKDAE